MDQERQLLEAQIQQTSQSLQRKIEILETKARESVSVRHQIRKRPLVAVATAVGTGLVVGVRLHGRPRKLARLAASVATRPSVLSQAAGLLLPVALGFGSRVLGNWAKKKYPKSTPYVKILQSALGPPPSQP